MKRENPGNTVMTYWKKRDGWLQNLSQVLFATYAIASLYWLGMNEQKVGTLGALVVYVSFIIYLVMEVAAYKYGEWDRTLKSIRSVLWFLTCMVLALPVVVLIKGIKGYGTFFRSRLYQFVKSERKRWRRHR